MSRTRAASVIVHRGRPPVAGAHARSTLVTAAAQAVRLARVAEREALAAIRRVRIDEVRRQARLHVTATGRQRRARARDGGVMRRGAKT